MAVTAAYVETILAGRVWPDMAFSFYELQLFVLGAFCICSVLLERHASKRKQKDAELANGRVTDVIENGGGATTAGWKMDQAAAAATLARQYLIVYGIVMGMCSRFATWSPVLRLCRRRLAAGAVRLLPV